MGLPSFSFSSRQSMLYCHRVMMMYIETERLILTQFTLDMAESVHLNSLDEDNRRFVPDEVFETIDEAKETIEYLMSVYGTTNGPLVYPVLLKDNTNIGYVQAIPFDDGSWEIGYHIGKPYTNKGYATEAVNAFLPVIMKQLNISEIKGICLAENTASVKVMEKTGFTRLYKGLGRYQGEEKEIVENKYTLLSVDK